MPGPRDPIPPEQPRPKPDADVTFSNSPNPSAQQPASHASASASAGSSTARTVIEPGTDFGPRYHIEYALGEGGMGSVYKAYDRELDRHIAIKVIRPNLVADASTVQRFKQELLLGSKVSHKHILRIHDLGDVEGLKFISMAYVDGEDLHSILRREGRLPVPRAIGIARQMAQALAAAHAEGVIHRDLKPHNILIDKSGTAYISDFGLAKSLLSSDAAMTRSGELLGTPRYMAPEQVEGRLLDHRVDLYAFGLILYEMVTGTVPFHGDSAIQELLQRVQNKPPDPRIVNADTPATVAEVILRCLAKDPAERFQSAEEILRALSPDAGGATMSMDTQSRSQLSARLAVPWWKQPAGRMTAGIAAALLVLAAAGAIYRSKVAGSSVAGTTASSGSETASTPATGRFLAVLPFRVLGNPDELRYVGDGVVEALSSRLFQVPDVRVVSSRDVEQARSAGSIEEAARSLGANMIVEGTVQAAGDRLRLVVNLHDVAARRQVWSEQFTGTRADLFTLQDAIYDGLVSALGVSGGTSPATRTAAHPTDDIEAYDLYLKGRDALRSSQDPQKLQAGVDFFQQAIRKDGRFALAHAGLADASLLMYDETKDNLWAERARAAALRARDLDDQMPEVFYSLGSVYSESGKGAEAVVVLKRALELSPHSDEAHRRLGVAYQELGNKSEAIGNLRKAVEVNPYFWVNHNVLGDAYLRFGDTEKSLEEFRRVTELEPRNPVGYDNIGSAYFARGEWEKGIPAYEQSLKLQPHWLTYSNLGTAYFYLKRYPEAVKAFEQAAALNPNDAITMGNLADGLRWSGQRDRALNVYATAISLAYKDLQVNPKDATTLAMVGLYQAKSGNDGRAMEYIRKARAVDSSSAALLYYEAVVHTLGGRTDAALASLQKALDGGYSAREAAEDPELAVLEKSPAFARMLHR